MVVNMCTVQCKVVDVVIRRQTETCRFKRDFPAGHLVQWRNLGIGAIIANSAIIETSSMTRRRVRRTGSFRSFETQIIPATAVADPHQVIHYTRYVRPSILT